METKKEREKKEEKKKEEREKKKERWKKGEGKRIKINFVGTLTVSTAPEPFLLRGRRIKGQEIGGGGGGEDGDEEGEREGPSSEGLPL